MESSYKKSLREARSLDQITLHPLINTSWSYKGKKLLEALNTKALKRETRDVQTIETRSEKDEVTAKIKALDSLNIFSTNEKKDETIDEKTGVKQATKKIEIPNIEEAPAHSQQYSQQYKEFKLINLKSLAEIYHRLDKDVFSAKFPLEQSPIDVLFITDCCYQEDASEERVLTDTIPPIFGLYFKPQVAHLFYNMTKAMKLPYNKFSITSIQYDAKVEDNQTEHNRVYSEILHLKPRIVMSLGAQSYQFFNAQQMRLKDVHGQFQDIGFKSEEEQFETKLMPLFSPNLLQTAPNMKKTAWADLQKAMEYLN